MSGDDSESMRSLRGDAAAAVRRVKRRFAIRRAAMYVTVLALTAGLVTAGVLARDYVHSLTSPWRLLLVSLLWLLAATGVFLIIALTWPAIRSQPPQVGHDSWAAAMRRFTVGRPSRWLIVLAVTAVLATAAALAYLYSPAATGGPLSPAPLLGPFAAVGVLLAAVLIRASTRRFRRLLQEHDQDEHDHARQHDLRAEPHTSSPEVTVEPDAAGRPTLIVRLVPHSDVGTLTLQEVPG